MPKWVLWVKMALGFAWMVSQRGREWCRCVHSSFSLAACFPSGKGQGRAGSVSCPPPGGWCETRISRLSTPQHLSVQGILGLGMSPVLPASHVQILISCSFSSEEFLSWEFQLLDGFLCGANCFSLKSHEGTLANKRGCVGFLAETSLFHCFKRKSGFVLFACLIGKITI